MSNIEINSTPSRVQYTATASQTEFAIPFPYNANGDLKAYQRSSGSTPVDATNLLTITTEYTLSGAGTADGGTMTLVTGATSGDIVTIVGDETVDRSTIINSPTKLTNTTLNTQFNDLTIFVKQLETQMNQLMLKYNNNEAVNSGYLIDNVLPLLTAGGVWRKNDGNTALEVATLPAFPVGSTIALANDNRMVKTDTAGGNNNIQQTGVSLDDSDNLTGLASMVVASLTYPTSDGTAGQVIGTNGAGALTFTNAGDGNVDGPSSATDNAVCRFSGTTGELIQNSGVIVNDSDAMTGVASIDIGTSTVIDGAIDDDSFATASATTIATSESIKAYVDASPLGDVVGPASSTDNAVARFDSTTGKLLQDSSVVITDADAMSGLTELAVDNLNLNGNALTSGAGVIAITPLSGQDLNITVDSGGEVFLTGAMDLIHTATENDEHALEIDCNAAGFGDVKAVDIAYSTGAIAAGEDEAAILINIDETAATGGDVAALEVLSTAEGSATIYGISGFVNVNPILHSSGTFGDMDSTLNKAVDVQAALANGGAGAISGWVADNDTMTFGDAAKFEEMEFILTTGASGAGIAPTFEYSTGAGPTTWATFSPIDGTNGMRNTGAIAWLVGDIPSWVVGDGVEFLIRITRTRNTVSTTPVLDEVQIAATTEYKWDAAGDLTVGSVTVDADPTAALELATKQYVDAVGGAKEFKDSAVAASTATIASTYANGASGVGATLTNSAAMAAFSLDGVSPAATNRVLIKNQSNAFENGIYTLTTVGDGSTNWVLTRATDSDETDELTPGVVVPVDAGGTVNGKTAWMQTSTVSTIGTDAVDYAQYVFNSAQIMLAISSTDETVPRFNGTAGQVQASSIAIDDSDNVTAVNTIAIATDLIHTGDTDNKISFGTDTQDFQTGSSSRLDISDSGVRLGAANARVTTVLDEDTLSSDSATSLATQQSIKAYVDSASAASESPNLLINGSFDVSQRGASFTAATVPLNSDDTYLFDRWILLSDGNDIVDVTQETTTVPTGAYAAAKLEVETSDKKFGLIQILEAKDAAKVIGGTASISLDARNAASDDKTDVLKAVILSWDSTADAVTSDVVSAWNTDLTIPTFATNWTAENTPSNLTLTQAYQTFTIENISVDTSSTANIAVFIWCDNADGVADDAVYISKVKVEDNASATAYAGNLYAQELNLCQRYYQRWERDSGTDNTRGLGTAQATATTTLLVWHQAEVEMFADPTFASSATDALSITTAAGGGTSSSAISGSAQYEKAVLLTVTVASTLAAGNAALYSLNTNDWISFEAEL